MQKVGSAALGHPINTDIRMVGGREAGVHEGAVSSASEGSHTLGGFLFLVDIQELLGHKDVSTTMIYIHVLSKGGHGVRRPIDGL